MAFDYPQRNGYRVGTDFDGSVLSQANFLGGQFNLAFAQGSLARRRSYACGGVVCRRAGDGQTAFFMDPHSAPFNRHLPHLYSIELRVQMPYITNGTAGCHYTPDLPTLPGGWGCGEFIDDPDDPDSIFKVVRVDQAYYEGRVDAGGIVFLDHSAVEIDPGFESQPSPGGAIDSRPWPNYDVYDPGIVQPVANPPTGLVPGFAYLENPDPVWPIPDAQGSTFGRVLFTLEQIPWEVVVTFTHHGFDHGSSTGALLGSFNGIVRGYLLGRRLQTIATVAAGIGPAGIRPRGRVVGQRGERLQLG